MNKSVFIYISGHPGSGKTRFAHSLLEVLGETSFSLCKFEEEPRRWQERPFSLMWRSLRYLWLLGSITLLIQSVRGKGKGDFPQSVRDAVSLVSSHYTFAQLQRNPPGNIVIIDEPPWHRLWIKMFPIDRYPNQKLFKYVISKLIPKENSKNSFLFLEFSVPISVCIDRIKSRKNIFSRFNEVTEDKFLKKLQKDPLYQLILQEIKTQVSDKFFLVENAQTVTSKEIADKIFDFPVERPAFQL